MAEANPPRMSGFSAVLCYSAKRSRQPSPRPPGTGGSESGIAGLKLLEHRLGAGDRVFAGLLDMERLDDAVFDQHRVALRADPHAFLDAVELEAHGAGEVGVAVAEHHHLALGPMLLAPGTHHEGVVDRDTRDRIDTLGLERGNIADIARQVAL